MTPFLGGGLFTILTAKNSHQKQGTKPLKLVFLKGFMRVKKFGWKIPLKNKVPLPLPLSTVLITRPLTALDTFVLYTVVGCTVSIGHAGQRDINVVAINTFELFVTGFVTVSTSLYALQKA